MKIPKYIENKINLARKYTDLAERYQTEIFEYLDKKGIDVEDTGLDGYVFCDASTLGEAITTHISYGEGDLEELLFLMMNAGEKENKHNYHDYE